jgi:hypothetical protein
MTAPVTAAERTLALLRDLARTGATTYAVGRLLQHRPELAAPARLPVLVPREQDTAFQLDTLAFWSRVVRQLSLDVEVVASLALSAGATWAQLATATRTNQDQAQARYGHLARRPPGGGSR